MRIVAPAYLLSELQVGFRIGAVCFCLYRHRSVTAPSHIDRHDAAAAGHYSTPSRFFCSSWSTAEPAHRFPDAEFFLKGAYGHRTSCRAVRHTLQMLC